MILLLLLIIIIVHEVAHWIFKPGVAAAAAAAVHTRGWRNTVGNLIEFFLGQ